MLEYNGKTHMMFQGPTFYPISLYKANNTILYNTIVAALALEFSRLGDDRWQRLSSGFVAQSAATFGVKRKHPDALATETGSQKGSSQRVHA